MSTPELEPPPLSPELLGLLERERETTAPAAAKARVWGRVLAELGPAGGGSGSDPGSSGAPPSRDHGASGTAAKGSTTWASAKLIGVVAFAVGALTGGTALQLLRPPPAERIIYVERPAPAEPAATDPVAPAPPPIVPRQETPTTTPPPTRRAKIPAAAPAIVEVAQDPPRPHEASREQTLIERARSALARGRADDAARALKEHQEQFPEGHFLEEREGLWVLTLWSQGDRAAARARAAKFKEQFPNSLLGPAIEARLR